MLGKSNLRQKLNRKQQRDLDIEISFMEGVVRKDPRFVEAWTVLSDDYLRRGKPSEGLEVNKQLSRIRSGDPSILYNLACSYSLTKNLKQSAFALSKAVANGFSDFKWMMKDPDLRNLRNDPLFKKIWRKISILR